jgi:hypothetical protein
MTSTLLLASSLAFASPAAVPASQPGGAAPTRHVRVQPAPLLALTPSSVKLRADRADGQVTLRLA